MTFPTRVAAKAANYRPVSAALTVVAAPFWLLGFIIGVLWLAVAWIFAAAQLGWSDAHERVSAWRSQTG